MRHLRKVGVHAGVPAAITLNAVARVVVPDIIALAGGAYKGAGAARKARLIKPQTGSEFSSVTSPFQPSRERFVYGSFSTIARMFSCSVSRSFRPLRRDFRARQRGSGGRRPLQLWGSSRARRSGMTRHRRPAQRSQCRKAYRSRTSPARRQAPRWCRARVAADCIVGRSAGAI